MTVNTSLPDYQACLGTAFRLLDHPDDTDFVLTEAKSLLDTDRQSSFSLIFHAPPPLRPQQTYRFQHARLGELHLFLVPIGKLQDGYRYQAVFNLLKST